SSGEFEVARQVGRRRAGAGELDGRGLNDDTGDTVVLPAGRRRGTGEGERVGLPVPVADETRNARHRVGHGEPGAAEVVDAYPHGVTRRGDVAAQPGRVANGERFVVLVNSDIVGCPRVAGEIVEDDEPQVLPVAGAGRVAQDV